jgi:predicted outer membrane protein
MTAGYHHVRRSLSVCAIALLAVSLAPVGVEAEPQSKAKTTKPAASNSALIECYKQAGMTYNPATKSWTMYSEEMVGIVKQDSLRQCMARATGVSRGSIRISETLSERYGGEPPRR